jgi:DNA-binding CsgD family transcriptional regulator
VRNNGHKRKPGFVLSPAEERVVARVAAGDTDKVIGRRFGVHYTTVMDQVDSAKRKLGAKTRAHLVSLWIKWWV